MGFRDQPEKVRDKKMTAARQELIAFAERLGKDPHSDDYRTELDYLIWHHLDLAAIEEKCGIKFSDKAFVEAYRKAASESDRAWRDEKKLLHGMRN